MVWVAQYCKKEKWKHSYPISPLASHQLNGTKGSVFKYAFTLLYSSGHSAIVRHLLYTCKVFIRIWGGTNKLNSQGMGEVKAKVKQSTSSDWLKSAYLHNPSHSWELFFILQMFSHSNQASVKGGRFSSWKIHQKQRKKRRVLSSFSLFSKVWNWYLQQSLSIWARCFVRWLNGSADYLYHCRGRNTIRGHKPKHITSETKSLHCE